MGVFKKSLSFAVTLSLVLGGVPVTSFADGDQPTTPTAPPAKPVKPVLTTPNGYSPERLKFCEDAPNMLKKLNDANKPNMSQLKDKQADIAELTSRMAMLNSLGSYRDAYMKGLHALSEAQTKTQKDKSDNLDNMKKVIRNGLVLDAIGLLIKNGDMEKDDSFTASAICANKENANKVICKQEEKLNTITQPGKTQDERGYFSPWLKDHALDKTLANFKEAYSNISTGNKDKLKGDLQNILNTIPDNIGPEAILTVLDSTAPGISDFLKTSENKDTLTKCLSEKNDDASRSACERLLPIVGEENNFLGKMTDVTKNEFAKKMENQSDLAIQKIKSLSSVIEEGSKLNIETLNQKISDYKTIQQKPVDEVATRVGPALQSASTTMQKTAEKLHQDNETRGNQGNLNQDAFEKSRKQAKDDKLGATRLFLKPEDIAPDGSVIENPQAIEDAKKSEGEWNAKCSPVKDSKDIDYCQERIAVINTNLSSEQERFKTRLSTLQDDITKLTMGDFNNIETMKKFLLLKYNRSCNKNAAKISDTKDLRFGIKVDGTCYSSTQQITTIDSLVGIADKIELAINVQLDKNNDAPDSDQMKEFANACVGTSDYEDVCSLINKDKRSARVREEERKKAEPVNEDKDYWVTSNGRGGFNKVAKKSTMRIVGEGVLPVVPQMIPMFFQNFAMTANISALTDQALYQKQMLYNYNLYNTSPWLYNYNALGGLSLSGYGNPFATTTTTTTGTATSTAGFGF